MMRWMRTLAFYAGIAVLACLTAGAGAVRAANAPQLSKAKVLKLQDEFQHATATADVPALDKLMASNCIFIHGNAMRQTKGEFIDMLKSGRMKMTEFKTNSRDVLPFNGGAIVLSVIDWGMLPPGGGPNAHPMVIPMRISNVWVHTSQGWQLILEQDTTLPQRGGMGRGGRAGRPGAPKQ